MPEPKLERQQSVLNLLPNPKGLEPLKKLFWSELNYDRVNQTLSRRGWKDGVASLLANDPVLFASRADAFHIIYARLACDKLLIGDERPVQYASWFGRRRASVRRYMTPFDRTSCDRALFFGLSPH